MTTFSISSPTFSDGESIPDEYGFTERNVNPPIEFEGIPDDTVTLALVVDDPDAVEPAGKVWDHWVVWNLPADIGRIPEGYSPTEPTEGRNDFGENSYGGPNPPDRPHTYRFVVYALDTRLDLPTGSSKAQLQEAIEGHVLAKATLEGTYAP